MICKVIQRNIRISHRKAALVCDLVRNKNIKDALVILSTTNKKFAPIVKKLLSSAISNATNNHAMNMENLYIYTIVANQGPTWKRTLPRAKGSADLIRKRTTHLVIELSDNPNERKQRLAAKKQNQSKPTNIAKLKQEPIASKIIEPKVIEEVKQEVKETKPLEEVKAKKPAKKATIDVNQKHTVVSIQEFEAYDYDKRRAEWHQKAGHNEQQVVCSLCLDDDNWESVKLENGDHICYYCWIKKPETLRKLKERLQKEGKK